jgi:hypothetical protein
MKQSRIPLLGKKFLFLFFVLTSILNANQFNKGMSYFIKGKYSQAIPHFVKASNNGNKQAQFYLANMYEKGLGVKKNKKIASKLYRQYTSKSVVKSSIKKIVKQEKRKSRIAKRKTITKKNRDNSYSNRHKKHYNPNLQGAKEVVFN